MRMIDEKLLLVLHRGYLGSQPAGIYMDNHCLPIAVSHPMWRLDGESGLTAGAGFHALWRATMASKRFFEGMGQRGRFHAFDDDPPNGLLVYEVTYHPAEVMDKDDGEWEWLCGGTFRRPTFIELTSLTVGRAPWGGKLL